MDEMTKVQYLLMTQINDLQTLRGLNIYWRLAKDHNLPKFLPYGCLKGPKIENGTSKDIPSTFIIFSLDENYQTT